jgi:hypothetical protein
MKMHVYFVIVTTDARLAASVRVNVASFAENVTKSFTHKTTWRPRK